jgi:hypothetical protein
LTDDGAFERGHSFTMLPLLGLGSIKALRKFPYERDRRMKLVPGMRIGNGRMHFLSASLRKSQILSYSTEDDILRKYVAHPPVFRSISEPIPCTRISLRVRRIRKMTHEVCFTVNVQAIRYLGIVCHVIVETINTAGKSRDADVCNLSYNSGFEPDPTD